MIKSKHFRKDVIIARVIFLVLCALVIAGAVWLISLFTDATGKPDSSEGGDSGISESVDSESDSDSEMESESDSDSDSESDSESEPNSDSEMEPDSQEPTEEPVKRYIKVTSKSNLNLRKEPSTTSTVLTSLPNGTKVEIMEELNGWFKVSYQGHTGYVSSNYVKVVEE